MIEPASVASVDVADDAAKEWFAYPVERRSAFSGAGSSRRDSSVLRSIRQVARWIRVENRPGHRDDRESRPAACRFVAGHAPQILHPPPTLESQYDAAGPVAVRYVHREPPRCLP
jgi:hypothetical protein